MDFQKRLDLSELIRAAAQDAKMDREDVARAVNFFLAKLTRGIAENDYAIVDGLGSFRLVIRKPRKGLLPRIGEVLGKPFDVGPRITVEFNANKEFRDLIAQVKNIPAIP